LPEPKKTVHLGGPGSIYNDPPTHWFGLVTYVARTPLEHEAIRDKPLLLVLAYADNLAREEKNDAEMMKAAMKSGNPMAGLLGGRRRR
jgi:hypothetical protein